MWFKFLPFWREIWFITLQSKSENVRVAISDVTTYRGPFGKYDSRIRRGENCKEENMIAIV
jgi:hypothetical protein